MLKRVVYIGGFGHWPDAADEFRCADVETVGAAPAYIGENISVLRGCSALPDDLPFFSSADELLKEVKPDIAVVSTRPDHIAATAVRAAEAGCDLICEKPLGLTAEEVDAVQQAVRQNGVRLLPMLSMRTDPVFIKARELYRSGAVGEASLINTQKSYRFGERQEWFGERSKYGGTFPWVGIHAVDMILFITGLEFVSVSARHSNFSHSGRPDCEDGCMAVFELGSGAFASASVDLLRPEAAPTHGDDRIRIAGTAGVIEACSNAGVVRLINKDGESIIKPDTESAVFYRELLSQQVDGTFPMVGAEDGFLLTRASLAARDSADQGGGKVQI